MIPNRWTIENLGQVLADPTLLSREIVNLKNGAIRTVTSKRFGFVGGEGVDVFSEDWENLIILDACRFDYFEEVNDIDGDLRKVTSKGGNSSEFIAHNFSGKELHDTVYVTSNANYRDLSEGVFHAIIPTLPPDKPDQGSFDLEESISPNTVVSRALSAHETYPNKRLIVHFMQPHKPYIGDIGDCIRQKLVGTEFEKESYGEDNPSFEAIPWEAVTDGPISITEYRDAYKENLTIALQHVRTLIDELNGKTVITSDHGELLFDRILGVRVCSHRPRFNVPQLREVPWLVVKSGKRREITPESPVTTEDVSEEVLMEQLEALGYK